MKPKLVNRLAGPVRLAPFGHGQAVDQMRRNMSYFPALNRLGFDANAVNFGVVAVQRFCGGKVVAVVVISMMSSG